jgi:hypothetical protein
MEMIVLLASVFIVMVLVFFFAFGLGKNRTKKPENSPQGGEVRSQQERQYLYGGVTQIRWRWGWQDTVAWASIILFLIFILEHLFLGFL